MNKFLFKLLLFLTPVLALIFLVELLVRKIPNDYSLKNAYLSEHSKDIENLILGSSHAFKGINPNYISGSSFNAAMFSQSLDYDLKILEKFENDLINLKTIIIPISYFSLYTNLETGVESWREKYYDIYYDFSYDGNLKKLEHLSFEVFNVSVRENISSIKDYYTYERSTVRMDSLGWYGSNEIPSIDELKKSAIEASIRHTSKDDMLLATNNNIINKMVTMANNNGWKIVLFTPPAYKLYSTNLSKSQYEHTIKYCEQISKLNTNVRYYNLIDSSNFKIADFLDADHLNSNGARKLSIILNRIIK